MSMIPITPSPERNNSSVKPSPTQQSRLNFLRPSTEKSIDSNKGQPNPVRFMHFQSHSITELFFLFN